MIGTHRVTLYRNQTGWGSSVAPNSQMTSNVIGWDSGPFETGGTVWAADGWASMPRGGTLTRAALDTAGIARGPGDVNYRVRTRITTAVRASCRAVLTLGTTPQNVWAGQFFSSGGGADAVDFWSPPQILDPGTYVIDFEVPIPASTRPDCQFVGPKVSTPFRADATAGPNRVDFLELFAIGAADIADITCLVDDVAIRHGRADTTTQPDPSSATLNLAWDTDVDALPSLVDVGAAVEVATTQPGYADRLRFRGRLTDVSMGWEDSGTDTPSTELAQLSAVSTLADLGRRVVGSEPWPVELDAQRVARVAALAGMPLDPMVSDPGVVQIRARDVDSQEALGVMRGVAQSANGIVWMSIAGQLRYTDANNRHNVAVAIELDACDVLVTPSWVRNLDGLTNEVSIGYGAGNPQPVFTSINPTSQAKWGRYAYTLQTELAQSVDAQAMGEMLMRRNYQPVWMLSAIPVSVEDLSATDTDRLLSLDISDLVHLVALPAVGSSPTAIYAWVEGWSETLAFGVHDFQLVLSDYCRTSPGVRWDDPPSTTWNTVPVRAWDDAICFGGPLGPGIGRWDDTPTPLRWDQVAPVVTWDTWVQPTLTEEAA